MEKGFIGRYNPQALIKHDQGFADRARDAVKISEKALLFRACRLIPLYHLFP